MVPHLVTALTGPLLDLEKILAATPAIERWFRWSGRSTRRRSIARWTCAMPAAGPVDTNLFPGGFHNLATEMLPLSVQAAMAAIDKYCPDARNLLLMPELHNATRLSAKRGAPDADFPPDGAACAGFVVAEITQPTPLALPDGNMLVIEPWCACPTAAAWA
jgi:glutamate--cysteine ligase